MAPDSFLAEYGTRQFEVTVAPTSAPIAADHAVITREMARAAAHRHGFRASFSPMPEASGVGNGVHIHMSLQDASGAPVTYAAAGPMGLSMAAQHFCAGVLHHLPAICAITVDGRQEQRDQDGDDGDHDEQLDQGEASLSCTTDEPDSIVLSP